MNRSGRMTLAFVLALAQLGAAPQPVPAAEITVTTFNDTIDAGSCASLTPASLPGPGGVTSLREAICAANNNPGADTVRFGIPGAGTQTISPLSPLPALTGGGTTIDGYTQFGAAPADDNTPAGILIVLDGALAGALTNGLEITSADNVVSGLAIVHFSGNGLAIGYATAVNNIIRGNHIGTASTYAAAPNGASGVFIGLGAHDNIVGGDSPAARNVLSGNGWAGVAVYGAATHSNTVAGNYLGVGGDGTLGVGNTLDGVWIYGGAHGNLIGGALASERNVISGNGRNGVRIVGAGSSGNFVGRNYIGPDVSGDVALPNTRDGVYVADGAQANTIGDHRLSTYNVISGNGQSGVVISGTNTLSNTLANNFIGLASDGVTLLGNAGDGVRLAGGAQFNQIGLPADEPSNIIAGNSGGVHLGGATTASNTIQNNYIGLDVSGAQDKGNLTDGVSLVDGAHHNLVGGDSATEHNVISGNQAYGVEINGAGNNSVSGNYFGLNSAGTANVSNAVAGVALRGGAAHNVIGGRTAGERNVISGNADGLSIGGAIQNYVWGNYIGTDPSGTAGRGNFIRGVYLWGGATYNYIGGLNAGERNVIAGNDYAGVGIEGTETTTDVVVGNYIGADATGLVGLGNGSYGVQLWDTVQNAIGHNVIAGNGHGSGGGAAGVLIGGSEATGNIVAANLIGLDASGAAALGNAHFGVWIRDGAHGNLIGGAVAGLGNTISANTLEGVDIEGVDTTANHVSGNYIGLNASGSAPVFGSIHGVVIHDGAHANIIGGDLPAERNVIAGHGNYGVGVWDDGTDDNRIIGNYIGTLADAEQAVDGSQFGVYLGDGARDNWVIGGHLAHANMDGVLIHGVTTTGNVVSAACVHENGAMGIHLEAGANGSLDSPQVWSASLSSGSVVITGHACAGCVVEVFASIDADGEGYWHLGSVAATAGGDFELTTSWLPGRYLTATARHPIFGTSEFSSVFEVAAWYLHLPMVER